MKKIINYVFNIWNKFINLFKKKKMSFEIDITNTIDNYITNLQSQNNYFQYLTSPHFLLSVNHITSTPINNKQKITIKFHIAPSYYIETELNFYKVNGIHSLEITEGDICIKGFLSLKRAVIFSELDLINNRLHQAYIHIYTQYYP